MLKYILKAIIICSLFFQIANAAPCSPEKIKYELTLMKLDPSVKTNKELLVAVERVYGIELTMHLTNEHPFILENPEKEIDSDTLKWLDTIIWDPTNKNVRYLYVAGDLSSNEAVDYLVSHLYSSLVSRTRIVPIFKNSDSVRRYKSILAIGNEELIKVIFKKVFPILADEEISARTKEFLLHFRKFNEFKLGFDFPLGSQPVIEVAGHSMAGDSYYIMGDERVSARKIVKSLLKMNLPINSHIKLTGCFTGCSNNKTSFTPEKIKEYFFQGKLHEIFEENNKESFLTTFSKTLMKKYPQFCGKVEGYLGLISSSISPLSLTRNGETEATFPVIIQTNQGLVFLKRDEASLSFSPACSS